MARGNMPTILARNARHHTPRQPAKTRVRGSIDSSRHQANNDVNETATNETPRVAAVHKNIIYVCNGRHRRYTNVCQFLQFSIIYVCMYIYICVSMCMSVCVCVCGGVR